MALTEKELEVQKEYLDTLNTLNFNSKPLIDVLTDVADENKEFARVIVKCIEDQLEKVSVDLKLPLLYLIDSIIKNEKDDPPIYKKSFCRRLHLSFANVYKEGKDDVRSRLSKLRSTWNGILPPFVLTAIDNEIRKVNPTWPNLQNVHVNPKFISQSSTALPFVINSTKTENVSKINPPEHIRKYMLLSRQQELLELKKETLEKMKLQKVVKKSEKIANQVLSEGENLKNSDHNPSDIQKVRETAITLKNSLLKSIEQNSKDSLPGTQSNLNDLIKKLDDTIKILLETEKNPTKRKIVEGKNHSTIIPAAFVAPVSKPSLSKLNPMPRAWSSKNVSTSPSNGTMTAASQNPPTLRIAPVSNIQLINAVIKRSRDPRLRKFEEQESTSASNVTATKEGKVLSASISIDTKNDKQNVLLTDVSKMREFVSDPISSTNIPAFSSPQTKSSGLKSVTRATRGNDRRSENDTSSSKPSKSNHIDSSRSDNLIPKSSVASSLSNNKKEDSSLSEVESSNIESIIPAAPSITIEKSLTSSKKDLSSTKKEMKSTKIRVKVIQKGTKDKSSKRSGVVRPESAKPSSSRNNSKANTSALISDKRQERIGKFVDALAEVDEMERKHLLEGISKTHLKFAEKCEKLVKKKIAAKAKSTKSEVPAPSPPSAPRTEPPIIIDDLMDIADDKNNLISVPRSNNSTSQMKTATAVDTNLNRPEHILDATDTSTDDIDPKCEPESIPMDISDDSEEKGSQTLGGKTPSETEEKSAKSAPKSATSTPKNLSEQLEAVMNARTTDAVPPTVSQDVDIRPLLPKSIGLNLGCALPVVSDIIAPTLSSSTDGVVATSTPAAFNNPFGLSQAPTQDIDYRQLFAFPLPTIPTKLEPLEEPTAPLELGRSPSQIYDPQFSTPASTTVAAGVVLPAADKGPTKRKPDEEPFEPFERTKRRRTISGDGSDSELQPAAKTAARSGSPEPPQSPLPLPLPPMSAALENILNVPSDSDEDAVEVLDDDDDAERSAGGRGGRARSSYSLTGVSNEDDLSSDASMVSAMEPPPASKSPPMFPVPTPNASFSASNLGMFMSATPEIPAANADVLKMIRRDPVRSIHIDGVSREIRHYGSTAVTFLSWDDPRQISFYNGPRTIIIDDDIEIPCYLNGPDVEHKLYGECHRFRLGAPTRELYVDGIGYECYFNGAPKKIRIGRQYRLVRLCGNPPRVRIGQSKRRDLVAGKIDMIIDEEHTISVYLDAKPQAIRVKGIPFVIMFIDSLKRVLINNVPFRTAFGGLPQSFKFKNKIYSFRFDVLPSGIVPGAVSIFQMIMTKLPSPPPLPPSLRYCDDLPTIFTPSSVPNLPISSVAKVEPNLTIVPNNPPNELKPPPMNNFLENVNIDELFQKLVASGIVPTPSHLDETDSVPTSESKKAAENNNIKFVDFSKPDSLKQKQPGLIAKLYSGIQCGSCGLRFPREQTVKYSQHLDWHFRLNRRGKDGARTIHSRKWYYNSSDWMHFQEMEDNSDRGTSWFESQAATEYTEKEVVELPCVSAGKNEQDAFCVLCQDKFEQFYNQNIEEWQLRNATRVDGSLYHPACHQDHTEREDNHSDVEEIVDLDEPIALDDSTSVEETSINLLEITETEARNPIVAENLVDENVEDLNKIVTINDDFIVIKKEKPDPPKSTEQMNYSEKLTRIDVEKTATFAIDEKNSETDEDSDFEEVQLIEQPIEEIIINDDVNDLEPNLETLNVQDIISVQREVDSQPTETIEEVEPIEIADKIVDITNVANVASIDGNIELSDALQVVNTSTKIKINITKAASLNEEKAPSPRPQLDTVESVSGKELDVLLKEHPKELTTILAQPLPPGEELATAAEIKARLKDRKLVEYPLVTRGAETSGLCSIM